jgi:hypothetical protein
MPRVGKPSSTDAMVSQPLRPYSKHEGKRERKMAEGRCEEGMRWQHPTLVGFG